MSKGPQQRNRTESQTHTDKKSQFKTADDAIRSRAGSSNILGATPDQVKLQESTS